MAFLGLAACIEEALPFHRALVGIGLGGNALAKHQRLMKAPRAGGQDLRQDFQRVGVAVLERDGMPDQVNLRVGFGLGAHPLLGQLFHLEGHDVRRGFRAARDTLEIPPGLRLGLVRLEVAYENERDVLG